MLTTIAAVVRTVRRLVLPRVVRHIDEYHFILPALAWAYERGAFSVAFGWWRWHVEFIWQNTEVDQDD